MKNAIILIAAFATILLLSADNAYAQKDKDAPLKIGYVDTELILRQMPEAIDADKKLKEVGTKYQDTLKRMQDDFSKRLEKYRQQEGMMSADGKKTEEDALKAMQQNYLAYQEEKFGNAGELAHMQATLMAPLRERIQGGIKEVAKEEKMSFIFDKTNPSMLFAEEKYDMTYRVLDKIKRSGK
ncbi:hypothetical protein MASR2M18_04600 [Ignavibacteria bacterium]|jgi:outer membrane protein|nr:OmpH family outer membrane protein [Bacteroidota bacterium]MCZ2133158.1 OmpH family outer membrane protein [Bacteroidota bacterium]